ncbi:MAG: ABC transporter permease [Legionella sp.]
MQTKNYINESIPSLLVEKIPVQKHKLNEGISDYWNGLLLWRLWIYMAVADIRRRYRLTLIGPFWTTLSLAIFILCMSYLFATLWHNDIKTFMPYFSAGYICWILIATTITEGCTTFISAEGLLKQIELPYSTFAWVVVTRNFLVFLHQIFIFILVALVFQVQPTLNTLLIIPGLILFFFSASWLAILAGLLCARFRDAQQVVASLLQISIFLTPVFWPVNQLEPGMRTSILINGNPLYHYLSLIRQPMLGQAPEFISWVIVASIAILGWFITMNVLSKKYKSLIFWL